MAEPRIFNGPLGLSWMGRMILTSQPVAQLALQSATSCILGPRQFKRPPRSVGGSGDALAFALIIFLTGVPLLYPWGARGQVPLAFCVFVAYLVALALGVRGELPPAYGIMSVAGAGASSGLGAVFLELHRRAIFHQRLLLARTRDQQMAVLYDVLGFFPGTAYLEVATRLDRDQDRVQVLFGTRQPF